MGFREGIIKLRSGTGKQCGSCKNLSHTAFRQFYSCWDGLSHKGELRQVGNKIGCDKISAVIFALRNTVTSTAWLPNRQSQTNNKHEDMSAFVSVHRLISTYFNPNHVNSGGEADDTCNWIEGGWCEVMPLWCVVVSYWLQVGRMEERSWGDAHILMSAIGDNSCYDFWSLPSKHTCSLLC